MPTRLLAAFALLTTLVVPVAAAQENQRERGNQLLQQSRYAEAEQALASWASDHPDDAEGVFLLAVSRAVQGKTADARAGFLRVLVLDPRRADACFEMAGTFIKTAEYHTALSWALRGLGLAPADDYGLELAGTASYLAGSKDEALRYWNRLGRPHLTGLRVVTNGAVSRQTVADEIGLGPGDLLSWTEVQKARWRLAQHRYFRSVVFDPVPGETPDQYALEVNANARRGFGSPLELLFNTIGEVNFRTLRFDYSNIADSTISLSARWRWTSTARWLQAEANVPRLMHVPLYWTVSFNRRDEDWLLPASGTPFSLRTSEVALSAAVPLRLPWASMTVQAAGRTRTFRSAMQQPDEAGAPVSEIDRRTSGVTWLRAAPHLVLPAQRLSTTWTLRGQLAAAIDGGWTRGVSSQGLWRASLSPEVRFDRTRTGTPQQTVSLGGTVATLSNAVVEDHFNLGVGPDADYPLRAHFYLRNGHPGGAPLAARFALANLTASTDVAQWNWFKLGVKAFADGAWIGRGYVPQNLPGRLVDTGIGLDLGSALFASGRISVMWGRNWHDRDNVFYVGTSLR